MYEPESYYVAKIEKIEGKITLLAECFRKHLAPFFSAEKTHSILQEAWTTFLCLLPELPFIGGDANPLTENLLGAAYELGMYSILENEGFSLAEISAVNQMALGEYTCEKMPPELLQRIRTKDVFCENIRRTAAFSQRRTHPGDWVSECVEAGESDDFDIGVDYTKCAIVELYTKHGKERYLPYLCANDFAVFGAMGIHIERTQTIGNGASVCDFRFRIDGERDPKPGAVVDVEKLPEFKGRK